MELRARSELRFIPPHYFIILEYTFPIFASNMSTCGVFYIFGGIRHLAYFNLCCGIA